MAFAPRTVYQAAKPETSDGNKRHKEYIVANRWNLKDWSRRPLRPRESSGPGAVGRKGQDLAGIDASRFTNLGIGGSDATPSLPVSPLGFRKFPERVAGLHANLVRCRDDGLSGEANLLADLNAIWIYNRGICCSNFAPLIAITEMPPGDLPKRVSGLDDNNAR
jgi:hypothetical protein